MAVADSCAQWTASADVPLDRRSIGAVLEDVARRTPDSPALIWPSADRLKAWTWRALHAESTAFAQRLLALAEPGDTVAVFAANSPDWVFFEYGAAVAGVVIAPINTASSDAEVAHVMSTCGATVMLADAEWRGSPLVERARNLAPSATVVELARWRELPPSRCQIPEVDSASPFLVQFTSGTTGTPKGAILSHRAAYNCARYQIEAMGGTAADNWLNVLPMHHVGGSVCVLLSMLAVGGVTTLAPRFDAAEVLRLIAESRPTIIGLVPTMQLALLDHPDFMSTDMSSLRLMSSGGSVVAPDLIRRVESAFGVIVLNMYGQSESPSAIMNRPGDDDVTKATTIGQPLPQRDVRIERADGTIAAFDEIGELVMHSPLTMDRYLHDSDDGRTLGADGWLHTGDLCSMDDRGVISIHGRLRDVIIRGGENIYPAEIESIMLRHPGISDIAVVGMPDDHWGEVPVACYVPARADDTPDHAALMEFARASLAGFKVPRLWVVKDTLPLTAAGKVKKFELQNQLHVEMRHASKEEP
jgi:fatty-acyl-CoA synthase